VVKKLWNYGFNQLAQVCVTTAPLGASDPFTSDVLDVGGNARLTGTVFSDQGGTLVVQQSSDGANWDTDSQTVTVTGGTGAEFSVEIVAPYAQLVYTNGATAQTEFRLYAFTRSV